MRVYYHMTSMRPFRLPLFRSPLPGLSCVLMALALSACGAGGAPATGGTPVLGPAPALGQMAALGEKMFHDTSLSASGALACASCHHPANAHAPLNALAVQLGGAAQNRQGTRSAPSLRYLEFNPVFSFGEGGWPRGGYNRDGRVQTLVDQAQRPFTAGHEMANASKAEVVARLARTAYLAEFRQLFGAAVLESPEDAFERISFALAQYQREDPRFHPYDSRYDAWLAGKATLTTAEQRGLVLFNAVDKGNCASCHPSAVQADGAAPLFTHFGYENLGVPRNPLISANANPAYFDLGLCGPERQDLALRRDLCGAFKTPTLRNVATRSVFFHNGVFTSLTEVVGFYARRDSHPEQWYPQAAGGDLARFNDLPPELRGNVFRTAPFGARPGMAPALTSEEVNDIVSFLHTLTDGYRPGR